MVTAGLTIEELPWLALPSIAHWTHRRCLRRSWIRPLELQLLLWLAAAGAAIRRASMWQQRAGLHGADGCLRSPLLQSGGLAGRLLQVGVHGLLDAHHGLMEVLLLLLLQPLLLLRDLHGGEVLQRHHLLLLVGVRLMLLGHQMQGTTHMISLTAQPRYSVCSLAC